MRKKTSAKKRKIIVNLLVLYITVIVLIIILEFFLELVYPQRTKIIFFEKPYDDNFESTTGWTDYRNAIYRVKTIEYDNVISINNEGFNDGNWTLESMAGEKRIVALGDSFTQAEQVERSQRFTEQLGQL